MFGTGLCFCNFYVQSTETLLWFSQPLPYLEKKFLLENHWYFAVILCVLVIGIPLATLNRFWVGKISLQYLPLILVIVSDKPLETKLLNIARWAPTGITFFWVLVDYLWCWNHDCCALWGGVDFLIFTHINLIKNWIFFWPQFSNFCFRIYCVLKMLLKFVTLFIKGKLF